MPFGNGTGYSVVRAYHCGPPTSGEGEAIAEMQRRVILWNRYVELERAYGDAVEEALAGLDPPFAAVLAVYRAARQQRREATYGEITVARAALLAARATYRSARSAALREYKAALKPLREFLEAERQTRARTIRQTNDCYVYNSTAVLLAYQQARQRALQTGGHLQFQRWEWEGKLDVQFTAPPPVGPDALPCHGLLQIDPGEVVRAWAPAATRSEQRHLARTVVRFRVRSAIEPGRRPAPVWVTLPVVLHRPIPEGTLQSASLQRRRVGRQVRWSLVLSIRTDAPADTVNAGRVGVDLGWRTLHDAAGAPDGLRVAVASDAAGMTAALVLRQGWLDHLTKCDELRGLRDEKAEVLRTALTARVPAGRDGTPRDPDGEAGTLPGWFVAGLHRRAKLWHSTDALERFVWRWRFARWAGDDDLFAQADAWREREVHLGEWEDQLRENLLLERRDAYRGFAKWLTERYGEVRLEQWDLRPLIQTHDHNAEGDPQEAGAQGEYHTIRRHRFAASLSTLVQAIQSAARSRGVPVVAVDPVNTTRECHVCGHVEAFDGRQDVLHTCGGCGVTWDQDENAAINLVRREADARAVAPEARGPVPDGELTRFAVGHLA